MGIGGAVVGLENKLGTGNAKADHSLRKSRQFLETKSLEHGGVELDGAPPGGGQAPGLGEVSDGVEVGGEEGAAAVDGGEVVEGGEGDGGAVIKISAVKAIRK